MTTAANQRISSPIMRPPGRKCPAPALPTSLPLRPQHLNRAPQQRAVAAHGLLATPPRAGR
jgi:hypothetical protein